MRNFMLFFFRNKFSKAVIIIIAVIIAKLEDIDVIKTQILSNNLALPKLKLITNMLILVVFLFATACKTTNKPLQNSKFPKEMKQIEEFDFIYLSAKAKVSYKDFQQNFKSSVDIRLKKDSAIWLSFRPLLGVEAMRVLITKDSVKILDRLKGETYLYSIKTLSRSIQFNLEFSMLQAAITGNLISRIKPDSITQQLDFQVIKQHQKSIHIDNYIHNTNQKIHKVLLKDIVTNNKGQVHYSQFTEVNNQLFAFLSHTVLHYYTQNNEAAIAEIELKYSKAEISKKPLRFPF